MGDIYFDRKLTDAEVVHARGQFFEVQPGQVLIQHGHTSLSDADDHILVVCGVFAKEGDFPTLLEVIPLRKEMLPTDRHGSVGELCELLSANALILYEGDDGTPYNSTLVRKKNDYQKVVLDHDLLDLDDEQMKIIEYCEKLNY